LSDGVVFVQFRIDETDFYIAPLEKPGQMKLQTAFGKPQTLCKCNRESIVDMTFRNIRK
jgi:hypothetical protein